MIEDLDFIAMAALSRFPVRPDQVRLIQTQGQKTVWRVTSGETSYALKRHRHEAGKVAFTAGVQQYLWTRGARVPQIIPDQRGNPFAVMGGSVFTLHTFVEGRSMSFRTEDHLKAAVEALADFHARSRGFDPPQGPTISSKLGRWPHQYASMLERLRQWKERSLESRATPFFKTYLAVVDDLIEMGQEALDLLTNSFYEEWVAEFQSSRGVCHQDFGEGNCISTERGAYIIDLDGSTIDVPARDLRKVLTKQMAARAGWDEAQLKRLLTWYNAVNPLDEARQTVLFIDMLFPHTFHDVAKNVFLKNKPQSPAKLLQAAEFELRKAQGLRDVAGLDRR